MGRNLRVSKASKQTSVGVTFLLRRIPQYVRQLSRKVYEMMDDLGEEVA
jgi:hypothetical protein